MLIASIHMTSMLFSNRICFIASSRFHVIFQGRLFSRISCVKFGSPHAYDRHLYGGALAIVVISRSQTSWALKSAFG